MNSLSTMIKSSTSKALRNLANTIEPEVQAPTVWRSTPKLKDILETDGKGNFRWCHKSRTFVFPRNTKKKAAVVWYRNEKGEKLHISLQKFVALIYHPVLNHELNTRVKDGDRSNLSACNIEWCRPKGGTTY